MKKPYRLLGLILFQLLAIAGVGFGMVTFLIISNEVNEVSAFQAMDNMTQPGDVRRAAQWLNIQETDTLNMPLISLRTARRPPDRLTQPARQAETQRPFSLPFAQPPGLDTWLIGQPYGNTTGAYRQRFTTYGASGGIHFGLDLSAPCGTEIVAIADGVVFAVDGPYGSPPHNLMIDHPDFGYASMYGHLLQAPDLVPGQRVQRGEVIALSGSSRGECPRGQHLHLEIRDLNHARKYNPLPLIDADWNNLILYGPSGRDFMRNLDEPRQWQTLYDQPEVFTGGPIVNDFERTWPFDWEKGGGNQPVVVSSAAQMPLPGPYLAPYLEPVLRIPFRLPVLPSVRQITASNCCTSFTWSADSSEVRFIDQPSPIEPLGVWGAAVNQRGGIPYLVTQNLGLYNDDRTLLAYPEQGLVVIERVEDGRRWTIETQGNRVSFTPNGQLMWTVSDSEVSWLSRRTVVWVSDLDGSNIRQVATLERGSPVTWLSENTLLISSRIQDSEDRLLSTLSLDSGTLTELVRLPNAREVTVSPDKRHLVYLSRFNPDPTENGLWLLDLHAPAREPIKLPFFGAYRWRNQDSLIYVPFDSDAAHHTFFEYNLEAEHTRLIYPNSPQDVNLIIANNDWQISPDGNKIALGVANGMELGGIWIIDLALLEREAHFENGL